MQLKYNQPNIYDHNIPPNMYDDFPILHNLNETVKGPPWFNIATLVSKAGQNFISFAKSKQFHRGKSFTPILGVSNKRIKSKWKFKNK